MKQKSVTLLCTSPYQGGTERVVQVLAARLAQDGMNVDVLLPATDPATEAATLAWHHAAGVMARTDPAFARENIGVKNVAALAGLLRRQAAPVVNIHYTETVSVSLTDVLACKLAGKRCVLTVQHPTDWDKTTPRKLQTIALALRLADAVTVSTDFTRHLMGQKTDIRKVVTIACGLPPPSVLPTRAEARRALHIPETAFVVSSLARLVDYKGIDDTLRALAALPDPNGELVYLVAGDGPSRADFERLAGETLGERARFLGRIGSADTLYAASDVFALPSHMEGFGLVYVEAAFAGVPSIGCRVAGAPFVIDDGRTGLLVPPGDGDALTDVLRALRDNPARRRAMGEAARARALSEFTDTVMADVFKTVLFGASLRHRKYCTKQTRKTGQN